ncbi:MAG: DUF4097 family beta strand repeat protein [Oscillospiraceae bacterium]|nr:DUF4097 family beta strand repeat protein [Oscillospiraceae bacterium]
MKTSTRAALIVAAVLILAGAVLCGLSLMRGGSLKDMFSTGNTAMRTVEVELADGFTSIDVEDTVAEISFLPAGGSASRVVFYENTKHPHTAEVVGGTLTVRQGREQGRKWFNDWDIAAETPTVTVYLSGDVYDSLRVKTDTGDVTIPAGFRFTSLRIDADTADISCGAGVGETAVIGTDTGDIRIEEAPMGDVLLDTDTGRITLDSVFLSGALQISSHTGNVGLTDVACTGAEIKTTTGKVKLADCLISGKLNVETDTGDVTLDASDADEIEIETDTGDVTGTLLSEKIFFVESDTGKIEVPRSMTGGPCEIETDTGDVKISIAE